LPEFRSREERSIDGWSAVLSMVAVLPVIYGVKQLALGGSAGGSIAIGTLSVLFGIGSGAVFLRRQRRLPDPLFDLSLLRNPELAISLAINSLTLFVTFTTFVYFAQYLQQVRGLPVLTAGLCTVPPATGFIVGSQLAPQLVNRLPAAQVIVGSLLIATAGLGVFACVAPDSSLVEVVTGPVLLALGAAPAVTLVTDRVVSHAPPERAGAAAALSETGGELGGALGIALLGTVGSASYRAHMTGPSGLNVPAAALDSLTGALAAAEHMAPEDASRLVAYARAAFVSGMHTALQVAVLVAASSAVLVYLQLGRARFAEVGGAVRPECSKA
jgi:DHA2 family multidrug resistance protein-like MFS transporter